jgi:hypothetical protein
MLFKEMIAVYTENKYKPQIQKAELLLLRRVVRIITARL